MASRAEKAERRKHNVIQAAHQLVGSAGIEGITFRAISKVTGIALGSLSYHYRDRNEIILNVAEFSRARFMERYHAALAGVTDGPSLARALASLVELHTITFRDQLVVDYEIFLQCLADPVLRSVSVNWTQETFGILEDYVDPPTSRALTYQMEGMYLYGAKMGQSFPASETLPVFETLILGTLVST